MNVGQWNFWWIHLAAQTNDQNWVHSNLLADWIIKHLPVITTFSVSINKHTHTKSFPTDSSREEEEKQIETVPLRRPPPLQKKINEMDEPNIEFGSRCITSSSESVAANFLGGRGAETNWHPFMEKWVVFLFWFSFSFFICWWVMKKTNEIEERSGGR